MSDKLQFDERCVVPSLWEGLGEGAELDADRPSPRPSPKGRGRKILEFVGYHSAKI